MKSKGKPGSKILTPQQNTNKKKSGDVSDNTKFDKAFFKKNEFALILLGAFLLTIIIFFIFFRPSDNGPKLADNPSSGTSFTALEKRIKSLETAGKMPGKKGTGFVKDKRTPALEELENRITRLETVILIKVDSLIERMDSFEKNIGTMKNKATVSKPPTVKPKATIPPVKTPVKKIAKTTVKKTTKISIFHTVQKKETLYSISKKYKTTVAALKKLNKLSEKDKIYPGDNIIIR